MPGGDSVRRTVLLSPRRDVTEPTRLCPRGPRSAHVGGTTGCPDETRGSGPHVIGCPGSK